MKRTTNKAHEEHFCKMMCEAIILYHKRDGINSKELFDYKRALGCKRVEQIYKAVEEDIKARECITVMDARGIAHKAIARA